MTSRRPAKPSPSPTPEPTPELVTNPFFLPPEDSQDSQQDPEPDPSWSSSQGLLSNPSSGDGSPSDTPSTGPASPAPAKPLSKAQLRKLAEGAVRGFGELVHKNLTAPQSAERDHGLWIPDDDDVKAISDPLAGIASRRTPAGVAGSDTVDIIGLVVGLVGYGIKQWTTRAQLRKAYQAMPDLSADMNQQDGAAA